MSKGSARRPTQVTQDEFSKRWDATFGAREAPLRDYHDLYQAMSQTLREAPPWELGELKNL